MVLASCHTTVTWNFEVVSSFLENLWTPFPTHKYREKKRKEKKRKGKKEEKKGKENERKKRKKKRKEKRREEKKRKGRKEKKREEKGKEREEKERKKKRISSVSSGEESRGWYCVEVPHKAFMLRSFIQLRNNLTFTYEQYQDITIKYARPQSHSSRFVTQQPSHHSALNTQCTRNEAMLEYPGKLSVAHRNIHNFTVT